MNLPVRARALLTLALVVYVYPGRAETTSQTPGQAEVLFKDALEDVKRDDWPSACEKFSQSARLEPRASSLVKVGICQLRVGHNVAAWYAFQRARDLNSPSSPGYRPLLEQEIQGELSKIPVLDISVTAPVPGLALSVDGAAIDPDLFGAPLPIELGKHQLVATAPGYARNSMTVVVEQARAYEVVLNMVPEPMLTGSERTAAPKPIPDEQPLRATTPTPTPTPTPNRRRTLGIAMTGLGAAGLAVGGALGLATLNLVADSNGYCTYPDGSCDEEGVALRERASQLQTAGIAVSVGASLALASGVYLILVPGGPTSDAAATPRASIAISGTTMVTRWRW